MHKKSVAIAFTCIVLLAGCQSAPVDPTASTSCEPTAAGEESDAVQIRGSGSAAPTVQFDAPLAAHRTQRTVVNAGDGPQATPGSLVTFSYAAFNGSTGELIDAVGYESRYAQAPLNGTSLLAGMEKSLLCATAGSRIAAVVPPADAFGDSAAEKYGISAADSVVLAIDIVAVGADRATGERQAVMDSLPRVDVAATGEPQITIPPTSPPKTYSATVLKRGQGESVTTGATVTVEYRGVEWSSGRTFDSTWYQEPLVRMPTSSFLKPLGDAIVGQSVGSQVLVIVPPAFGYGDEGNPDLGIEGDETMVFVIDILAVVQPPVPEAAEE